jgi:hypothetical protein
MCEAFDHAAVAMFAAEGSKYVPNRDMAVRSFKRWLPECRYFLLECGGTEAVGTCAPRTFQD